MLKKDIFRLSPAKEDGEGEKNIQSVGARLKDNRLRQGLSLEDVATDTSISISSLKALEENDSESLPAHAFVKGFITIYGKHLGLNPDELLAGYRQQESTKEGDINAHAIIRLNPGPKGNTVSPVHVFIMLGSVLLLLAALYWGYTSYFSYTNVSEATISESELEQPPAVAPLSTLQGLTTEQPSDGGTPEKTPFTE